MKDRNRLLCIALTACAVPLWWVVLGVPSLAQGRPLRQEVRLEAAQAGTVPITVWPGSGANLDFSRLGLRIYRAWLDDPSKLTIDFDAPLDAGGAQVVHLRRISGVHSRDCLLPRLPYSLWWRGMPPVQLTFSSFRSPMALGQPTTRRSRWFLPRHQLAPGPGFKPRPSLSRVLLP
ncbi:hypothetical protein VB780_06800 [Leptolyngbya sp. CCNP1308]|uniref:hypothetical protein n=1 Tax=Leptolyngbya sp. CCNP1308 TaxID=3110255 RepID=UPI002B20C5C8|nr:hypothetical protein [Leptolyngbya sp. CCNP1308]MEA5448268.1 hypothetical protein [Leptolyngbya sp. CCNP1308]